VNTPDFMGREHHPAHFKIFKNILVVGDARLR